MRKFILILSSFLLFLTTAYCQTSTSNQSGGEIIYHVFQRSFYDSNGDLNGDLNGLKEKLDYLQELGVTSILLLPFFDSDCYHNYFANDFERIDPSFGTMNDYIALVKEVHRRGMKIYLDMETQYVTEKHLWWRDAVGNLKSPYSNYILFQDPEHTKPSTIVYDITELDTYDGKKIKLTTVNLKSKEVLDYNIKLFSFFADPDKDGVFDDGADGFRLDHMMDDLDNKPELTNLFADFWTPLIHQLKKVNPKIKFIAEQANWLDYGFDYFKKADVDMVFGFWLTWSITSLNKEQITKRADTILGMTPKGKEQIIFLENHDIDRSASTLKKDPLKEKAAAAIYLLIGGTPSVYYGQELGMFGKGITGAAANTDGKDIPRREAFEWYRSDSGKGMAVWYKDSGPWWDHRNIIPNDGISLEEERSGKNSLFNFYKTLIRLRKGNPALSYGSYQTINNNNDSVLTFLRSDGENKVLVAANLSGEIQKVNPELKARKFSILFGNIRFKKKGFKLKPYEIAVWSTR